MFVLPQKNVCSGESSVVHLAINVFVIKNLFPNIKLEANKYGEGNKRAEVTEVRDYFAVFHTM